mmetsp:Transcript_22867/g.48602  ORF Transcript_22867/g.48602 Transcript_22867/m.48602 type:complete len:354 (-) Transcript_22867:178-1239(-)
MARPVLTRVKILLAVGFAFVCGWVDAVCLIRYKAFATMMTGNMIQMGYCVIYPKDHPNRIMPDPIFYLTVILSYFFGIVIYRLAEVQLPRSGRVFGPLAAIVVMALELSMAFGDGSIVPQEEPRWIVCPFAAIFAVQNMMTMRDGLKCTTAFITGHLQNIGAFGVEVCRGNTNWEDVKNHAVPFSIMVSLVLGSFGAALWDKVLGTEFALVPIAPMMMVLFILHDFVIKKPKKNKPTQHEQDRSRGNSASGPRPLENDIEKAEAVRAKTSELALRKQGSMYSTRKSKSSLAFDFDEDEDSDDESEASENEEEEEEESEAAQRSASDAAALEEKRKMDKTDKMESGESSVSTTA